MDGLKPILNDTSGIWIDPTTSKLMIDDNGTPKELFNSDSSSVIDVAEYRNVTLSETTLRAWLSMYDYEHVINQWVTNDERLVTIGSNGTIFGVALSDGNGTIKRIACIVNNSNWQTLMSAMQDLLDSLQAKSERLVDLINSAEIGQEYVQLVKEASLSDYVSFQHLVKETGKYDYIFITSHEIYYGNDRIYRDYKNVDPDTLDPELRKLVLDNPLQPLQYDAYNKTPIYERLVKEGDVIDICVAYMTMNLTSSEISSEGATMIYNSHLTDDGNHRMATVSAMIMVQNTDTGDPNEVMPSRIKIGDDILIEVTVDDLVVYSTNPNIVEYFVKSCRLIKQRLL